MVVSGCQVGAGPGRFMVTLAITQATSSV